MEDFEEFVCAQLISNYDRSQWKIKLIWSVSITFVFPPCVNVWHVNIMSNNVFFSPNTVLVLLLHLHFHIIIWI